MIDNSKEYILCAAYLFKEGYVTPNIERINKHITDKPRLTDVSDVRDIYYQPHRQVFDMAIGWRHPDILYKYGDCIQRQGVNGSGGFMTSKGRYVTREEAAEIAYACGQIKVPKKRLFSEDIY